MTCDSMHRTDIDHRDARDVRTYVNIGSCDALGMQTASPGQSSVRRAAEALYNTERHSGTRVPGWQAAVLPCTGSHESGVLVMGCKDGTMKAYSFRSVSFLAHAPLQVTTTRVSCDARC
eukprot:701542-Rhodomonas_salina.1